MFTFSKMKALFARWTILFLNYNDIHRERESVCSYNESAQIVCLDAHILVFNLIGK